MLTLKGATPIWMRPNLMAYRWLLLVVLVMACGASQREKTLQATLTATNAARDGFVAWDDAYQMGVVDKVTTSAEADAAEAKLDAYVKRRGPVIVAFEIVYRAIAIAAILNDDPKSLTNVALAAQQLRKAIEAIKQESAK